MARIRITLEDDDGREINGDQERLYDVSGGATRLVDIEAAVENFKQAALPELTAELLTLAQHQFVAEVKKGTFQLGRHKARCVAVRLPMPPVENRTDHFPGLRLSPCGLSPCAHEAFLPIAPAPQCLPRGQLARSLGTSGPGLPQARSLRHASSSSCGQLACPQTPTPPPSLPEASGVRWGLPSLLPTPLRILQEASRVHRGGRAQHAVGGV